MKNVTWMASLALALYSTISMASVTVPRCFVGEPGAPDKLIDGKYVVTVSTAGLSAKAYAKILNQAAFADKQEWAMVTYDGDGSDLSGEAIELDFTALTEDAYKKLIGNRQGAVPYETVKEASIRQMQDLANLKGVTAVRCQVIPKFIHHGSFGISN